MSLAKVQGGGRVVIPAAYRKALALRVGDVVQVELAGEELRIVSRTTAIARARSRIGKYVATGSRLCAELIAERRAEAARE
ncbi:MAG: AbrB/MazE/SpoVT family DNA-binding domain-containing protein [Vulcanimicrobiaceae bacterium]